MYQFPKIFSFKKANYYYYSFNNQNNLFTKTICNYYIDYKQTMRPIYKSADTKPI